MKKKKTIRICLNAARLASKTISSMLEHLVLHSLPGSYHSFHFTYIFVNSIYAYLKGKNSVSYSLWVYFFIFLISNIDLLKNNRASSYTSKMSSFGNSRELQFQKSELEN